MIGETKGKKNIFPKTISIKIENIRNTDALPRRNMKLEVPKNWKNLEKKFHQSCSLGFTVTFSLMFYIKTSDCSLNICIIPDIKFMAYNLI